MSVSVNRSLHGALIFKMTTQSGWHKPHGVHLDDESHPSSSIIINIWIVSTQKDNCWWQNKFKLNFNTSKGYQVSGCSVFKCEMSSKVICHMIRVSTWQRCTYGANLEDRKRERQRQYCHTSLHIQHSPVGAGCFWTNTEISKYLAYKRCIQTRGGERMWCL